MNRRDFLKVLRDVSVAVPVMAVVGKVESDGEQAQSAAEIEVAPVTYEKIPSLPFSGGTIVYCTIGTAEPSVLKANVFTQGRWEQM